MENLGTEELHSEVPQQELELAQSELRAALIFAKFSSNSYSTGNLQHATDAHSKAKAARERAARRLAAWEFTEAGDDSVKLILHEVEDALARLPGSIEFKVQVRQAGGTS
jgi:hypothetical protein